jgi:hypothetical protein
MCPLGSCKVSLLCSALILVAGCTAHFKITRVGHTIVESEPSEGAVHPYPWRHQPQPAQSGPLLAVYLATAADLEVMAKRRTHHLYFRLLPCSQKSHGFDLFSGPVFAATDKERSTMLPDPVSGQKLYKVHVPLDPQRIFRTVNGYGDLEDVPAYLRTAEKEGLCVRVGGAQMWGLAMFSNLAPAPLALAGETLTVIDESTGR